MHLRALLPLSVLIGGQIVAQNFIPDPSFGINGVAVQSGPQPYNGATPLVMETLPDGRFLSLHTAGVEAIKVMRCTSNGEPDSAFAVNGHCILAPASVSLIPSGLVVGPDGKIIISATGIVQGINDPKIFLFQLLPNGEPDPTFGVNGLLSHDVPVYQVLYDAAIQPDGKILVAGGGSGSMFVARFLPNGALDETFATEGIGLYSPPGYATSARTIGSGPDGSIYIGGYRSVGMDATAWAVAKTTPNGSLDPSFGDNGFFIMDHVPDQQSISNKPENVLDLLVLDNGSVMLGGYVALSDTWERLAVMKLDANGQPDPSFGVNGELYAGTHADGRYSGRKLLMDPTGYFVLLGHMRTLSNEVAAVLLAFDGIGTVLDQNGTNSPFHYEPAIIMGTTVAGTFDNQGRLIVAVSHWNQPEVRSSFSAFTFDLSVGMTDHPTSTIGLSAWPNPTSGALSVSYELQHSSEVTIDLVDATGRHVARSLMQAPRNTGTHTEQIMLDPALTNGLYFIDLNNGTDHWSRSVLIAR